MALPTLHWRMLQPVIVPATGSATTGGIAGIMDAIYTMGTATTYADGSARNPGTFASPGTASLPASVGTGSAWTWNFDNTTFSTGGPTGVKTACYAYPPTTTAINQAIVFGGASNTTGAAWKQLSTDTRVANYLYGGIGKNTGTYGTWNNGTTAFTSGDFTGMSYFTGLLSTSSGYIVYMLECEEAVAIFRAPLGGGAVEGGIIGAFVDPLSVNTANAETDGRLYGITSTGNVSWITSWLGTAIGLNDGQLFNGITNSNQYHFYTFTPGAGTVVAGNRFGNFLPTGTFVSRNGDLPQIPHQCTNGGVTYLGQLRQINITRDSAALTAWEVGGVVKGYTIAASTAATGDAMILVY